MRLMMAIAVVVWSLASGLSAAHADKRVALVIGNSAYRNAPRLDNPANDAAAMTELFRSGGFDVVESRRDIGNAEMRRALRDFSDKANNADIAVVYFAGHGVEIEGMNYLLPVDASLERDRDAYDEAVSLDRVLQAVEPARQLRLVILDACRDNPFVKTMKRTVASRAIGRGLSGVETSSSNTLIAFAAKGGSTAADGNGKNSPFTTALTRYIARPGLEVRKAFGLVRDEVIRVTDHRQEPFVYGSLGGGDIALVPAAAAAATSPPNESARADMRRDYELALQIGTTAIWDSFIANYPSGFYTDLARAQRDKLAAEAERVAATARAKAAADDKARLATDGAAMSDQTQAAARAKLAEEERIAAETNKAREDARLAAIERARVAALTPPAAPQSDAADLARRLQAELRRVGCGSADSDGTWNAAAQKSLALFNSHAGTRLDVKVASLDALEAVKGRKARVCPLVCRDGYKADGDSCEKIVCKAGYELGDDNRCERIAPKRDRSTVRRRDRDDVELPTKRVRLPPVARPSAQPQGQVVCNYAGCRPVSRGCHIESRDDRIGLQNVEICN